MNEILPVGGFDLIEEDLIILKKILSKYYNDESSNIIFPLQVDLRNILILWYQNMEKKSKSCYVDIDSVIIYIETNNFYQDIAADVKKIQHFKLWILSPIRSW